ncbi:MAG: lactate utilization protein [Desulfosarcina sp.]|nr:lactate utilization protein [Desulfosarcina sp.]
MSSHKNARARIMARLHASGTERTTVPDAPLPPELSLDREAKIDRLAAMMTAMRTDVHIVDINNWIDKLKELAREKGWKRLLYGPGGPLVSAIETAWPAEDSGLPELVAYREPVETFKEDLFQIDAGITSVRGGVADTGAVVLWPTPNETRLVSLVPPVHVAVLDADTIYNSLSEMMASENWSDGMPTNALLISGPSKTADIEFTLVFGVHGPKELIVIIRK